MMLEIGLKLLIMQQEEKALSFSISYKQKASFDPNVRNEKLGGQSRSLNRSQFVRQIIYFTGKVISRNSPPGMSSDAPSTRTILLREILSSRLSHKGSRDSITGIELAGNESEREVFEPAECALASRLEKLKIKPPSNEMNRGMIQKVPFDALFHANCEEV